MDTNTKEYILPSPYTTQDRFGNQVRSWQLDMSYPILNWQSQFNGTLALPQNTRKRALFDTHGTSQCKPHLRDDREAPGWAGGRRGDSGHSKLLVAENLTTRKLSCRLQIAAGGGFFPCGERGKRGSEGRGGEGGLGRHSCQSDRQRQCSLLVSLLPSVVEELADGMWMHEWHTSVFHPSSKLHP